MLVGQHAGDVGEQPGAVEGLDLDRTRKTEASDGAQSTSTMRSSWVSLRSARLTQSARCTETPWPRVTKPRMSSPGTGVQHLDRRTQTSAAPSTTMPESVPELGRAERETLGGIGVSSARSSWRRPSPLTARTSFSTTDWALTRPSPTAA